MELLKNASDYEENLRIDFCFWSNWKCVWYMVKIKMLGAL